jgi:hypothetical protein
MADVKDGGQVFPNYQRGEALPMGTREVRPIGGMSLRDYFVGQALTGLIERSDLPYRPDEYARDSYRIADAMLKAREVTHGS